MLGIAERGGESVIEGVADPERLLKNFWDTLRNQQRFSHEACRPGDALIEALGDKRLIVIRVPAAPRRIKPVYVGRDPYQGTFVRRHEGDYLCTKDEVSRMIREASDTPTDATVLPKFGLGDLDSHALASYRRYCQTRDPTAPRNSYDDRRFLEAVGGYSRDRDAGIEGLTVAGLLLLGREEAIREWRRRHLIDYRLYSDRPDRVDQDWDDRLVLEGNLWNAFLEIYPRLTRNVETPFRLEGAVHSMGEVQIVLREALINLLVHADYSERQASLIVRSPKGFLFRNPGSSRVPESELLTGDRSDPRNPNLVRMFRLAGLAEEAGSGMPRIIRTWKARGFQLPTIDVGTERYEFTLELRHVHLLSDDDRRWLESLGDEWTEAEQLALVHARHEGSIDNWRLRQLTGQHPADVTKLLGGLRNRGLLQMTGVGRGASYQLGPLARDPSDWAGTIFEPSGQTTEVALGSATNALGPVTNAPGSATNAPDSATSWSELCELARAARERRRLSPDRRDAMIVELCARVPLSVRELAQLLERTEGAIHKALRALLADGRLAYLYPDHPNDPRQKYVASQPPRKAPRSEQ